MEGGKAGAAQFEGWLDEGSEGSDVASDDDLQKGQGHTILILLYRLRNSNRKKSISCATYL